MELGLDQVLGSASTLPCALFQIPKCVVSGHLGLKARRSEGLAWLGDGKSVEQGLVCDRKSVGGVTNFCKPADNTASKVGPIGSPAGHQASMTLSPRQAHKNTRESSDRLMPRGPRGVGLPCAE